MKCFYSIIALLIMAFSIHAQTPAKKPVKQCNAQLARQIVEQQADFSKTLGETDQRVNVLIKVADFLWLSDRVTARGYFAEAFQVALERFREKGLEKNSSKGLVTYQPDYRFDVINAIAKRDAEWAKKLSEIVLKEFDEDKEKDKRESYDQDHEVSQLLIVAANSAKDNPALAATLARRAMRYPPSVNWYFSLYEMARNNQTLADQIYAEALVNYADAEVFNLLYLSAYPFGSERIFGTEKYSVGASVPAGFSPNPDFKRQFLTALLRRVMKLTTENLHKSSQTSTPETAVAVIALNDLEPIVAQQFPDLTLAFSQAKIHANSIVSNELLEAANKREEDGRGYAKSFAEKLKDLEKAEADGKLKDFSIVQMITSAKKEEDYQAAETWLDKIAEEAPRESTKNYYYFKRSKLAATENRFDDAQKYAQKIPKIEHRAVVYFDIAAAKQKNAATGFDALDSLSEVYKMAQKSPDTVEKAQVFLGLAYMYETIDHFNALDALSNAIKTANKLEKPNLFTSSMTQQIIGKAFGFYTSYAVPGFDINKTFYDISQKDFQGATAQAESFTDKYLRTLAVLASVKDCEKIEQTVKPKGKETQTKTKPN